MQANRYCTAVLLISATVLSAGCSDRVESVTGAPVVPPPARDYSGGGVISIQDGSGLTYTLDTLGQQIVRSDGTVLHLDAAQTSAFAAAYTDAVGTERSIRDLNAVAATYTPGWDDSQNTDGCTPSPCGPEPMSVPEEPATDLVFMRDTTMFPQFPGRAVGAQRLPTIGRRTRVSRTDGVSTFSVSDDPCSATVQQILPRQLTYFPAKDGITRRIFELAVPRIANGILRLELPVGIGSAEAVQKIAEHQAAALNVNVLTWLWNTYRCGSSPLNGGTIYVNYWPTGSSGSFGWGASYDLRCEYETWPFSFDGGRTWYPVNVRVCQYVAM